MKKITSLVTIADLKASDINQLLSLGETVKKNPHKYRNALSGKKIGLIFEKPSTRTWVSFETGVFSLGGSTIYLGPSDIQLGVREEIKDVARVLDRYLSGIVLRTFKHKTIKVFQEYFKGPVINGLSDEGHPCQALADFMTIREFSKKKNPLISFIGDGNNVLSSLLLVAAKTGASLHYAVPEGFEPSRRILTEVSRLAQRTGAIIKNFSDPHKAVKGADFIYTDVWVSMGEEKIQAQKRKAFKKMQVNAKLLKSASSNVKVMHCLPAHRGEEITDNVIESKHSIVFDQAENRLHIQKAILLYLFGKKS